MPALLVGAGAPGQRRPAAVGEGASAPRARAPCGDGSPAPSCGGPRSPRCPCSPCCCWRASPLLGITFGTPDERVLPKDAESRQVSQIVREEFGGSEESALFIALDTSVPRAPLASYAGRLAALKGVERVETSAGTYSGGRATTGPADSALGRPDAQRINVVSSLTPKSRRPRASSSRCAR